MKTSNEFKNTISDKLAEIAEQDALFKASFEKENKNIDDCIQYILNTVQKSRICGFMDEEIYSMAMHYYDEDNIDVGGDINCQVVVNHTVQLTDEEKKEARQKAIDEEVASQRSNMRKPKSSQKESTQVVTQQNLF